MENQCQHPLELQDTYIMEHGLMVIDHVTSMPVYGEPYVSPHLVIGLNQRGWVKLEYDMQPVEFHQHGISVIFPDHVVLAHETSEDYLATLIVMSKDFFEALNHRSTYRNHLEYLKKPDFMLTEKQYQDILSVIDVLRIVNNLDSPARIDMVMSTLDVFSQLVDEYRFANIGKVTKTKSHELLFSHFCDSISKHYRESREVRYYAELQHLSPKHFAMIIKDVTGISATQWIANYVIIQAKAMLRHHLGMSIQQVSDALGFPDQSTFSRYFKRHVQMSPSDYRAHV
jgi:AraC-like DNA-binding protein